MTSRRIDRLRRGLAAISVFLTALLSPGASVAGNPRSGFDFATRLGIAEVNSKNGFCLAIDSTLAPGTAVTIVWALDRQSVTTAVVDAPLENGCAEHASSGAHAYYLKRVAGAEPTNPVGIAIVNPPRTVDVRDGSAHVDLDGDGRPESFRICTSDEGLHFTVWSGLPLRGKLLWHYYYDLGYDTVPSCDERDYRDPV